MRLGEVGVICFEDGGRGHKPENPGGLSELEEAREQTHTQCLQKEEALTASGLQPPETLPRLLTFRPVREQICVKSVNLC